MSEPESSGDDASHRARIADYLRDAVVELEVWRQNARSADERHALQRVMSLLGHATAELTSNGPTRDPAQRMLRLPRG